MKLLKRIPCFLLVLLMSISCSKEKSYSVKEVVLTFDDAPNFPENTSQILDVLKKHQTKATFFCIGQYLRMYHDLARRISSEQYMANHTYTHINIAHSNLSNIFEKEITQTQLLIDSLQPSNLHFFRPPYGKMTYEQRKDFNSKGIVVVMWDLSAEEWDDKVSTQQVVDYFHNHLYTTAQIPIILFHLNKSTIEALDILLDEFDVKGIKVTTLDDLVNRK